jgi:hypothetical protein
MVIRKMLQNRDIAKWNGKRKIFFTKKGHLSVEKIVRTGATKFFDFDGADPDYGKIYQITDRK